MGTSRQKKVKEVLNIIDEQFITYSLFFE